MPRMWPVVPQALLADGLLILPVTFALLKDPCVPARQACRLLVQ